MNGTIENNTQPMPLPPGLPDGYTVVENHFLSATPSEVVVYLLIEHGVTGDRLEARYSQAVGCGDSEPKPIELHDYRPLEPAESR